MNIQEFEQLNIAADKTIEQFNEKYAGEFMVYKEGDTQTAQVTELKKYLGNTKGIPISPSFTDGKFLPRNDISTAYCIVLMVYFKNPPTSLILPKFYRINNLIEPIVPHPIS